MAVSEFPDPGLADDDGLVALGADLRSETLLLAYRKGIFPWPHPDLPLAWFSPPGRAILERGRLRINKSLGRARKRSQLRFTVDQAFAQVIGACAKMPRPGQDGTWITRPMLRAYCELHRLGHAHSVEAWSPDGRLVGGIYGVDPGGAFAAESMFYREPYASKLALLHLVDHLFDRGVGWLDIQIMTPHMEALGATVIPRERFLAKLAESLSRGLQLFPAPSPRARDPEV